MSVDEMSIDEMVADAMKFLTLFTVLSLKQKKHQIYRQICEKKSTF
jgi:hypothetical protein